MRIIYAILTTLLIAVFTHFNAQAMTVETPTCHVSSEGIYRGTWVKHRIYVNDDVVYGANDLASILTALENLRGQGLCR